MTPRESEGLITPTELEILRLAAQGYRGKEIAEQRGISEQTVKNHLTGARHALRVDSTIGAFHAMGWMCVPEAAATAGHSGTGEV